MVLVGFLVRKLSKKVFGDVKIGNDDEDPFHETVYLEKTSFWTAHRREVMKKHAKPIPEYIPSTEREVLISVRKKAYRLDIMFQVFGVRFGWLGIIGLIPVAGNIVCALLCLSVYRQAETVEGGLPIDVKVRFIGNICIDFLLRLIPIVGDVIGIAYKANSRNTLALERYLKRKYDNGTRVNYSVLENEGKEGRGEDEET